MGAIPLHTMTSSRSAPIVTADQKGPLAIRLIDGAWLIEILHTCLTAPKRTGRRTVEDIAPIAAIKSPDIGGDAPSTKEPNLVGVAGIDRCRRNPRGRRRSGCELRPGERAEIEQPGIAERCSACPFTPKEQQEVTVVAVPVDQRAVAAGGRQVAIDRHLLPSKTVACLPQLIVQTEIPPLDKTIPFLVRTAIGIFAGAVTAAVDLL